MTKQELDAYVAELHKAEKDRMMLALAELSDDELDSIVYEVRKIKLAGKQPEGRYCLV